MERSLHEISAADGVRISFELYRELGGDALLIICPGFFQSKETPTFRRLAAILSSDCDVACMDFRGHGRSSGGFTFSAREPADLNAVLDWAQQRYARIGLLGFSLGAATAINTASHRPGIRSLIAVSAPASFEEIEFRFWAPESIRTGIRGMEPGAGFWPGNLWLKKDRPVDRIRGLSPVPVLLIHGTGDRTVLHRHSERLHEAAGEPKRLILIEGGGHAEDLFRQKPERFLPPVQEWLRKTLLAPAAGSAAPIRHEEGWLETGKEPSLYWQRWAPAGDAVPLVILDGGGEHSGRYGETAARLTREGYAVHAFDLPGHGRSPGKRGHISSFDVYIEALRRFITQISANGVIQPPVLIGHSLGGLVATLYAVRYPEHIRCLVLSSPLWGLSVPVPGWQRLLARLLSPLWPSLTLERPRQTGAALSHDPQVEARYQSDPLVHFRASVRLYTEIQDRCGALPRELPKLKVPLLLMQAGSDRVVSPEAVKRLFPAVGSARKQLILYEGFYHELFNEVEKERVFRDLLGFLVAFRSPAR